MRTIVVLLVLAVLLSLSVAADAGRMGGFQTAGRMDRGLERLTGRLAETPGVECRYRVFWVGEVLYGDIRCKAQDWAVTP